MIPAANITVVCGPTASGKSALAVEIAQKQGGIVINADSMQVYDALPMLTAQPAAAEMGGIRHRLYAVLSPDKICSAQIWRTMAAAEIETALARGLHPVLAGGTGLYLKALIEGLSAMPDIPESIRGESRAMQARLGNPGFHAALEKIDPVMARRLNPNDTQRLIRAYEVMTATGKSLTEWQSAPASGPPGHWRFKVVVVMPERAVLYDRCDRRFDAMMDAGVLEEVQGHIDMPDDAPVTHALGFRPLRAYLRGEIPREQAVTLAKAETRQYAKRQCTWFRHQIRPHSSVDEINRLP